MTVHILFNGRSYCGLSILHQWPAGDTWIGFNDPELDALADCEACEGAFGGVVFMGCRVGDPHTRPIAGTTDRPCDDCSAATMFAPSTLARPEVGHPNSRFVCIECGVKRMPRLKIATPSEAQKAELAANGIDPEAWPLREHWGKKL